MDDLEVEEILAEPNERTWFSVLSSGYAVLLQNAWFIVGVGFVIYYIWKEKLSHKYYKWKDARKMNALVAKVKKDPALCIDKEEARMSAIKKFQDEYNKQAIKMKEMEKEKNDKKRDDVMKKLKQQGGRKLNDNYFPLSGKSSMSYVAPPRRTGCPGGC